MTRFTWGAAAASYQIEGRFDDDGRGECVWDMFCRQEGKVRGGHSGQRACMHITEYAQDARLMGQLSLDAYRLSVSWPRVLPQGVGKINAKGLAFYDELVDALLANNVQPWVTLFHWDYPYALFLKGGWLHPDSSDWFAEYTRIICDTLSDRVQHWITLNEPQCFIHLGHHSGEHAPGLKLGLREVLTCAHNSLLAHGKAVSVLRSHGKSKPIIGAAPVGNIAIPASDTEADIAAARTHMFAVERRDTWNNSWFAEPMILGQYPDDGIETHGPHMPTFSARDMDIICQPLDFYGTNIYTAQRVGVSAEGAAVAQTLGLGEPYTSMDWLMEPQCLYWACRFFHERYQLPIVITENGMANNDWPALDGKIADPQRIDYVHRHIQAIQQAQREGVPVDGYFLWSILDNFEWAFGYGRRFGLVFVDYATQTRIPKSSAYWYRDFIRAQRE